MPDFKCLKCGKKQNEWELDFRMRVATCKTCSSQVPEERLVGPWRTASGLPVTPSERAE
jgi:hypothetical protein